MAGLFENANTSLLNRLKFLQEVEEQRMADIIGATIYTEKEGFSQEQLYTYGGRNDSVFTLLLKNDSDGYQKFGSMLTVCFEYSREERKALEENSKALDKISKIKAKLLIPCEGQCKNAKEVLLEEGINTRDIIQIVVLPFVEVNNTFPSKEKRTPKVMNISFEAEGNGNDIGWVYEFLKRQKENNIGMMPDDEAAYLAYKLILERVNLTEEEMGKIFNIEGKIKNKAVAYHFLMWKNEAGLIKDSEIELLNKLKLNQFYERVVLVDNVLKEMGINMETFIKKHSKSANLILTKILRFHDRNFNTTGKYPLYMNFQSLLHIYFRHTSEMDISKQYAERDKFQLEEENIMVVMDIVMRQLNDVYQKYKEKHPNGRFFRAGKMAFYYNGDYYHVYVNPDGCISSFYKGSGNKR